MCHCVWPLLLKQRKRAPVRNILALAQKPSVFTQTQDNWKFYKADVETEFKFNDI